MTSGPTLSDAWNLDRKNPAKPRVVCGMSVLCVMAKRRFVIRGKTSLDRPGRWREAGEDFPAGDGFTETVSSTLPPTTGTVERHFGSTSRFPRITNRRLVIRYIARAPAVDG
jgi:hypothetical protein